MTTRNLNHRITVTKAASAYVELSSDQSETISAGSIAKVIAVPETTGIGASVIFFWDGSSMNVTESAEEIQNRVKAGQMFEYGFSKN